MKYFKTGLPLVALFFVIQTEAARDYTEGAEDVGSIYDVPEVVALEKKRYHVSSDITTYLGFLPMDAFTKSITFGLSYTAYYGPHWGWEVINAQYCKSITTSLQSEIENVTRTQVQGNNSRNLLDFIGSFAYTSAVYTPIYSKSLFFNKDVLFNETSFVAGFGVVNFESGDRVPMVNAGMQWRLFLANERSLKTDLRFGYHTGEGKSTNMMIILNIGYSWHLGSSR